MLDPNTLLQCRIDPVHILRVMGFTPCPWQETFLRSKRDTLLNIHRKAGKSFTDAVKGLHRALFFDNKEVLIISPSENQSYVVMRFCQQIYMALQQPVEILRANEQRIEYANGSRIMCLPASERTIVAYGGDLIILDEASRIPDPIYEAVRPMRAYTHGQLLLSSTPFGQQGFFFHECMRAIAEKAAGKTPDFDYFEVHADVCPWISKEFLELEERSRGPGYVAEQYFGSFTSMEGLIYPDMQKPLLEGGCMVGETPDLKEAKKVGGIDWGWTDPFCALWGHYDRDRDVIWITSERYLRNIPLAVHVAALKPLGDVEWVGDYHSPASIAECRVAGLNIRKAIYIEKYEIETGIAAVTSRIQTGRLRILKPRCPNTLKESQLYIRDEENAKGKRPPVDNHNHAMDAIRGLVVWIDRHYLGHGRARAGEEGYVPADEPVVAYRRLNPFDARDRARWEAEKAEDPDMWQGEID